MKKLPLLVKIPLQYGAIAGVLGALIVIGLYYIGKHPLLFPVYFDFRIILFSVFIYFTLREYRDIYKEGILYLWEGIIGSFIFVTVFAIISSSIIYAFGIWQPEFVKSFIQLSVEQVKNYPPEVIAQIGKENFDLVLKSLPTTSSYDLARKYFGQCYIISFFVSIVLSVILRRHPKTI